MTTVAAFTSSDLTFEESAHLYRLPDGRTIPSVTQILHATGVAVDFEALGARSDRLFDAIQTKRALGTALHADCHAFDDDDLDWDTVHPLVQPYLTAWADFREMTGLRPTTRERRVYHPIHDYCGTLDGIFLTPQDRRVLIDLKTGDPEDAAAHLQTAGYEAAYLTEHSDETIDERWAVQLVPDAAIPYRITPYSARPDAWRDFQTFLACVTVYHAQPGRRRAIR